MPLHSHRYRKLGKPAPEWNKHGKAGEWLRVVLLTLFLKKKKLLVVKIQRGHIMPLIHFYLHTFKILKAKS